MLLAVILVNLIVYCSGVNSNTKPIDAMKNETSKIDFKKYLNRKHLNIIYGKELESSAKMIGQSWKNSFRTLTYQAIDTAGNENHLNNDICIMDDVKSLVNKTNRFYLNIMMFEDKRELGMRALEDKCDYNSNILYLKKYKQTWVALLFTSSSDILIPIDFNSGSKDLMSLDDVIESYMFACAYVYENDDSHSKSMEIDTSPNDEVSFRNKIVVAIVVTSTVIIIVVLVLVYRRRRHKQKEDTKGKSHLLADWASDDEQESTLKWESCEDSGDTKTSVTSTPRKKASG